jgi:putative two-component system response regulator
MGWSGRLRFLESLLNTPDYFDIAKLVGILSHMREPYDTHGPRVAGFAARLATAIAMSPDDVRMVTIGAHLHDIGKLIVRADILNAPRKLNDAERAEMQSHVRLGYNIVQEAGYATIIKEIVMYHHEKWNGTGYPHGLMGDAIPMPAQVVAVCDVYEAMTNARPYRESYSHSFTEAFMKSRRKIDFNAVLVDLFFEQVMPMGEPHE